MATVGTRVMWVLCCLIVAAGALMAICIGLILPHEYIEENYTEYLLEPRALSDEARVPTWLSERSAARTFGDISNFQWLVSLSRPLYVDIPQSIQYICSGVIVSETQILTGHHCVFPNQNELSRTVVRSNSDYFWKEGNVHQISTDVSERQKHEGLYILRVAPPFPKYMIIKLPLTPLSGSHLKTLHRVGWGGSTVPNANVLKNDKFNIETWSTEAVCKSLSVESCDRYSSSRAGVPDSCCKTGVLLAEGSTQGDVNGQPLITEDGHILVGIQFDIQGNKYNEMFAKLYQKSIMQWLAKEISQPKPEMVKDPESNVDLYQVARTKAYVSPEINDQVEEGVSTKQPVEPAPMIRTQSILSLETLCSRYGETSTGLLDAEKLITESGKDAELNQPTFELSEELTPAGIRPIYDEKM